VAPHPNFVRRGDDLHSTVSISFVQAALGDEIEVQTIDGKIRMKVPPGTQSHTDFRLRDKGMPHLQSRGMGDLHVRIEIVTPTGLTNEQRELLHKFGKLRGEIR
jgi:molecular chaperone DnaJ